MSLWGLWKPVECSDSMISSVFIIAPMQVYKELERGNNLDFWTDMTIIVADELLKLQKLVAQSKGDLLGERREGIHQAVSGEVANVFKGKSPDQLEALKAQITAKVHGNEEGVDVAYWESLLSQLNGKFFFCVKSCLHACQDRSWSVFFELLTHWDSFWLRTSIHIFTEISS